MSASLSSPAITSLSTASGNGSCPPCAIGVEADGLNQIAWYTESIDLTLDTVSIFVTAYNGSNRTAVTRTETIYGDLATVNVSDVVEAQAISSKYLPFAVVQYGGGGSVMLARQTDGAIESITSIPWPTPFIKISTVHYTYTSSYGGCPSGLQYLPEDTACGCGLTSYRPLQLGLPRGATTRKVGLPSDFYIPLDPTSLNFSLIANGGLSDMAYFNQSFLSSWLVAQPWASSLLPNIRDCAFNGGSRGPPGIKIPVGALTSTARATVTMREPAAVETPAKPANTVIDPLPVPTKAASADELPDPPPAPTSEGKTAQASLAQPIPKPTSNIESSIDRPPNGPAAPATSSREADSGGEIPNNDSSNVDEGVETKPAATDSPDTPPPKVVITGETESAPTDSPDAPIPQVGVTGENESTPTDSPDSPIPQVGVTVETESAATDSPDAPIPQVGVTGEIESAAIDRPEATTTQVVVAGETVPLPPLATSNLVVAGTTLTVDGPAATLSGQIVSLANGGLVVDSSTLLFPAPVAEATAIATVDGQPISRLPDNGGVVVAGSTISRGAPAISINGVAVSVNPSALVFGSNTVSLPPSGPGPTRAFTAAGQAITQGPSGIVISGQTLTPGAPAIAVSGTPISLADSDIVIGASTIPLPTQAPSPISRTFEVGGYTFTSNENGIAVADDTLTAAGAVVTVSGKPISLGASGLVIGTSTYDLPAPVEVSSKVTIGGQTFDVNPSGIVIAGQTLATAGDEANVSGTPISLGSSGIVIGTSTYDLPAPVEASSTVTIGGQTFAVIPSGIVVAGQTLTAAGDEADVSGTPISLGPSGLVIGTSTYDIPTPSEVSNAVTTIGGQAFTINPSGIFVAGTTLMPGASAVTISGTAISLGASGLVVGTSTYDLPKPTQTSNIITTIDGQTFTISPDGVIIDGKTLAPGASAITISGTPVSLGASGLVVGSSTYDLPTPTQTSSTITSIGGQTFTISPDGGVIIAGTTLTSGASGVTISGTPISLGASGLVVGSSTYTIPTSSSNPTTLTFNGETYTIASGEVHVDGTVISAGQEATISGTEISLGASGLVVGSQTITLPSPTQGLGDVIMGAFGPHGTASSTGAGSAASGTGAEAFTGSANGRAGLGVFKWLVVGFVGCLVFAVR